LRHKKALSPVPLFIFLALKTHPHLLKFKVICYLVLMVFLDNILLSFFIHIPVVFLLKNKQTKLAIVNLRIKIDAGNR